jgi:hypothetical protein
MNVRLPKSVAALALLALVAGVALARAEVVQKGTLRVSASGRLTPQRLPRRGTAPIAVSVGGRFTTTDGSLPPQLKSLRIELNRHGRLETRGLPVCHVDQVQPASTARALKACGRSLVGRGSFSVDVVLGGAEPYPTKGRLLVFNGVYGGHPALLGQIYSAHPFANSFVIPFAIHKRGHGGFGVALTATLPPSFVSWGHVTGLQLRLSRRYIYGGVPRSFISAGCPAPTGFPGALFSLARISFSFVGGQHLSSTLIRNCTARG